MLSKETTPAGGSGYGRRVMRIAVAAGLAVAAAAGFGVSGHARAATARPARSAASSPLSYYDLSCAGPVFCVAVGVNPDPASDRSVLELWNGRTWHAVAGPARRIVGTPACGGSSFCLAAVSIKHPTTLVWNGEAWHTLQHQPPEPLAVTCVSRTFCVSPIPDADGHFAGMAGWNGSWWPAMAQGSGGCIDGGPGPECGYSKTPPVCGSAANCAVSGGYCNDDECDSPQTFYQSWNGSRWTASTQPPVDASSLESCAGRSFCMVLQQQLVKVVISRDWEHNWHDATANLAAVCGNFSSCGQFPDVSCGSPEFCMVLPDVAKGPVLVWKGTTWKAVSLAKVGGHLPTMTLVSCGDARNCTVTGTYQSSADSAALPVAEHWNGSAWHVTKLVAH